MGKFYDELDKGFLLSGQEREEFFKNYDARLRNIDDELNVSHELLDFLYTSDTEGNLSPKHCRRIWNVIKDYDEDFVVGYAGWGDKAAKFKDFKEIVKQCRDKNIRLYWDKKENAKKQIIHLSDSHDEISFNNLDFNSSVSEIPYNLSENLLMHVLGNSVSCSFTKFENDRFFRVT